MSPRSRIDRHVTDAPERKQSDATMLAPEASTALCNSSTARYELASTLRAASLRPG